MNYVPIDTACSLLSKGVGVQVSDAFLEGLIADSKINLYVRVFDGLAKPTSTIDKFESEKACDFAEHFSKFSIISGMEEYYLSDDLAEVAPNIFKCCKDRCITTSVDEYLDSGFPPAYESGDYVFSLVSYEKAYWVFSERELYAYLESKFDKTLQESTISKPEMITQQVDNQPEWKALKKYCGDLGNVLLMAWRIGWEEKEEAPEPAKGKPPSCEKVIELVRMYHKSSHFQGYGIELYQKTFKIKGHHKKRKSIEQSWKGIKKKYENLRIES